MDILFFIYGTFIPKYIAVRLIRVIKRGVQIRTLTWDYKIQNRIKVKIRMVETNSEENLPGEQ